MLFYKVKKQCDGLRVMHDRYLIEHELYTESERKRYKVPKCFCEAVDYPLKETFTSFGCRFIIGDPERKRA